jgi:hypothetical protein
LLLFTNEKITENLAKKPAKGGIPDIENMVRIISIDNTLLTFTNPEKSAIYLFFPKKSE